MHTGVHFVVVFLKSECSVHFPDWKKTELGRFRDKNKSRKKKDRECVFTKRGLGNLDNISPVMTYRQ